MKILKQLLLLCALCVLGEALSALLPIPFPGSLIGMLLLLVLLVTGAVKRSQVEDVGGFLLDNMAILFLPAGVGILESLEVLAPQLLQVLLICAVTTFLTYLSAAYTVKGLHRLMEKRGDRR